VSEASQLEALAGYLQIRAEQRANDVAQLAASFTPRELLLIKEAAVMGYVQGGMGAPRFPHGRMGERGAAVFGVTGRGLQRS